MRTLTIRFCIDDAHLEEIQIEAPTGVSLRNLIKDAKRGLNRHSASGAPASPGLVISFRASAAR
jgi:hypothetical protein